MADDDLIRRGDAIAEAYGDPLEHNRAPFNEAARRIRDRMRNIQAEPHAITVAFADYATDTGPEWTATHVRSGIEARASNPADALAALGEAVPMEVWRE